MIIMNKNFKLLVIVLAALFILVGCAPKDSTPSPSPVSYTHLDVYKRQLLNMESIDQNTTNLFHLLFLDKSLQIL